MNRKFPLIFSLCALLAIYIAAPAKDQAQDSLWLTTDEVQAIVKQEPPPPALGSDADKADLKAELDAQNSRTPERIAEAKTDVNLSLALFDNVIGFKITPDSYPQSALLFHDLHKQVDVVIGESKGHWQRLRPYQSHSEIHSLFTVGGYSYPSGHSTVSFAFAVILGQLFPDKAQAFLDRAHQIAQSRVDAGVHYESDIKEGEVVGKELAKELLAKPGFKAALDAAKKELSQQK